MTAQSVPAALSRRLRRAAERERLAAQKLDAAREALAHELRAASDKGVSIRVLAQLIERKPTWTHKLMNGLLR